MIWNERAGKRWEKSRANGRTSFIWKRGVIGYGLFMAISISGVLKGMDLLFDGTPFTISGLLWQMLISLLIFLPVGYGMGAWMWLEGERHYHRGYRAGEPV
jgi:hypothetical protein